MEKFSLDILSDPIHCRCTRNASVLPNAVNVFAVFRFETGRETSCSGRDTVDLLKRDHIC